MRKIKVSVLAFPCCCRFLPSTHRTQQAAQPARVAACQHAGTRRYVIEDLANVKVVSVSKKEES